MQILKCNINHLELIYELENSMFPLDIRETKSNLIADIENGYYYGLFEDNDLLGYFCVYENEGLYLNNIIIKSEYQGNGYSKFLILYIKNLRKENNIDRVWLHVFVQNDTAIGLYNKCGFKIKEVVKDFYALDEDALMMEFR
jgi:ribosomal protein S18 acetylase RimI-like enzyme